MPAPGGPRWWVIVYLLVSLPSMLFLALWMPLNEAPDEWTGIVRADSLRRGQIFGERVPGVDALGRPAPQAGIRADWALLTAAFVFPPNLKVTDRVISSEILARQRAIPWQGHTTLMMVANTAPYMPLLYAPGAIGLAVGEAIGLGPYEAIRLGRILMGLGCLSLGVAALWLAPFGHALLMVALALPMSLSLGASFNMDGMLVAAAALAAGCLMRARGGSRPALWVATLALALVIAAKPPYAPLAALILCTGSASFRLARLPAFVVLAVLPGLAWLVVVTSQVATDFVVAEPYAPGPLWNGAVGTQFTTIARDAQAAILLRHPWLIVSLPWATLRLEGGELFRQMIGVLAQLSLPLPGWVYRMWELLLPLVCVSATVTWQQEKHSPISGGGVSVLIACAGILATIAAVVLSQYVSWTHVGAETVAGVQGRYFLPILAFLTLGLPRLTLRQPILNAVRMTAQAAVAIGVVANLVILPSLVLATYYR